MDTILSILTGGASGAVFAWFLNNWLSERLKQSIAHEYNQRLETYRAELNLNLQEVLHLNQLSQLRTSLFFDHQRDAFAAILSKIAEVKQKWVETGYDSVAGLVGPVPSNAYRELQSAYYHHQLFLDGACLAAMELLLKSFQDSLPFDDGSGTLQARDVEAAFDAVEYLQPRLAELFKQKIGVTDNPRPAREISLFGAIKMLNSYHFEDIGMPVRGSLHLGGGDGPGEAVVKAEENFEELVAKLRQFKDYLHRDGGVFHEAEGRAGQYLDILSPGG